MSKIDHFYSFGLHCVLPEVALGLLRKLHKNFLGANQEAHPLIVPAEGPKIRGVLILMISDQFSYYSMYHMYNETGVI